MGSTATSKAVKKTATKEKKDSGTKKSARKAAPKKAKSRTTPVKKKAAVRKKAAAPKKATSKKTVGKKAAPKKTAPRKKAATKVGTRSVPSLDRRADVTAIAGTTPNATNTTATDAVQEDEKSLSWMAAQAANALKAVRANQNARAQDLLAKVEIIPTTPVKTHQKDKTRGAPDVPEMKQNTQAGKTPTSVKTKVKKPAEPDVPETKKDKKVDATPKPVEAVGKQVTKESPAVVPAEQTAPDKTPPAQSVPVTPEPAKRGTVKAAAPRTAPAQPEITESAVINQHDIPPAHVIAATPKAPGNRRSKRLLLLTGIIVLVGVLGARAWFSDKDTADVAAVQDSAETELVSPVTANSPIAKPSIEVITRVASEPTVKPATAATHPAWPEPADTLETPPTVAAMPPETSADEAVATEPQQQQATPQTTAAAPQATSPVAPQPAYYAPGYGYYPQQPVQQQPYYRPAYSRPSYSQ